MNCNDTFSLETKQRILNYLIPDSTHIQFVTPIKNSINDFYDPIYEIAYIEDKIVQNEEGVYLSSKEQGKRRRYYLTTKIFKKACNSCGKSICVSAYCRGVYTNDTYYKSRYIGTNVIKALLYLFHGGNKK
jgi:hypothetical protein